MIRLYPIVLIFCFLTASWSVQGQHTPHPYTHHIHQKLQKAFQEIMLDADMKHALVGMHMVEEKTGTVLFSQNQDITMASASTMKVITTATALQLLGANFKYETTIFYTGKILGDGTLDGNLYIKGAGDPSLGYPKADSLMAAWAALIAQKGIKRITGEVIGDGTMYESQLAGRNWSWEDVGNWYGAGASGLNIGQNMYKLTLQPGKKEGDPTTVLSVDPLIEGLTFINEIKTGAIGTGDNGYIFGGDYGYAKYLRGTIPAVSTPFSIKGSVPEPPLLAAQLLVSALKKKGITVVKGANMVREGESTTGEKLHTHYSAPLATLIDSTNVESINLYAESFFKMIGYKLVGKATSEQAAVSIKDFWADKGVDMGGFFMEDGCGMSRYNGVTPKQMTEILMQTGQSSMGERFKASLPIVGKNGTVKNVCKGQAAAGKIRAKSGYVSRVRGYSGYATSPNGKTIVFSILVNNYDGSYASMTRRFEKLLNILATTDL